MADLPAPWTYGEVVGTILLAHGDDVVVPPDGNDLPDAEPAVGTVTFTPSPAKLQCPTGTPVIVLPQPVTVDLDAAGSIPANTTLISTDNPLVIPVDWTYRVSFVLEAGSLAPFDIEVPAGTVVDLAVVAPVASSGGTAITKGDQGDPGPQGEQGDPGPPGPGVPNGGLTGHNLVKLSNADQDTGWSASGAGDMVAATYDPTAVADDAFDRGNHHGTIEAADVSDFDTEVGNQADVAANTAARHTHANKTTLDAITAAFTTADETKLDGIQAGATANATDAQLRDRATHTGTQPASTVTGLAAVAISGSASDLTTGTLPTSVLPSLAITSVFVVGSQAAMLALTAQEGDVAVRTDVVKSFILSTNNPGTLADWVELPAIGSVQSVNGQQGIVVLGKGDVGLGNVDNTSDASKPVSTAAQAALDLKAPLASPAFTGTPTGITKGHVGLGNVDNTSDANKPVSTATQTALDAKEPLLQQINAQTGAAYSVVAGDLGKLITRSNTGASTHTIPTGLATGHKHHIFNRNTGVVTIGGAGITFEPSATLKLAQYAGATVIHLGGEVYAVVGKLTA